MFAARTRALQLNNYPYHIKFCCARSSMVSKAYERELEVATAAAKAAGAEIRKGFTAEKQVDEKKNSSDLVTETDVKSENMVMSHIREAFPSHAFIGEESAAAGVQVELTDQPTWMCDPLDGTTNFVHGYPFVCVSIALVVNQEVVVGVVYNPVLDELFTATKGGGSLLNGKPIQASQAADLSRALLATEVGTTRDDETFDKVFGRIQGLAKVMRSVRCCGSCALNLCSVASGRVDAFFEIGFGGCWDVAAGSLIVTEAGGAVCDPAGGAFHVMSRRVLAGSRAIIKEVAAVLEAVGHSKAEPGPL